MNEKAERRKFLRAQRSRMSAEERAAADSSIVNQVVQLPAYVSATIVLTYLSFAEEVDTRALIERAWADGKSVAIPRCAEGRRLEWYRITSLEGLELSRIGVEEPPANPANRVEPSQLFDAIAIVPGLEFDAEGFRMGYGGGYYDTFLETFTCAAIGLCREEFINKRRVIREPHDIPVDLVVTESRIIPCEAERR